MHFIPFHIQYTLILFTFYSLIIVHCIRMVILHCILRYKSSELNWVQRFGEKLFEAKNTAIALLWNIQWDVSLNFLTSTHISKLLVTKYSEVKHCFDVVHTFNMFYESALINYECQLKHWKAPPEEEFYLFLRCL